MYSNQNWYQDAPLRHLYVYQISRESDYLFLLYDIFHALMKRKKMKRLSQFLKVYILEAPGATRLKFGMRSTDGGGHLHSKNRPVSYKQHEVMYTQKLHYCSSCQYTHGCGALASWAARHTTMCFDHTSTPPFCSSMHR